MATLSAEHGRSVGRSPLGFDTAEQQYAWLVTSILRDWRLNRIPCQAADVPDNE
jgi:hypothetical protein